MNNQQMSPVNSERGIALIVVLLLLAVVSGLVSGLAFNGQVEVSMAHNEVYYAGARAAAEAGINRAIEAIRADTTHSFINGVDGAVDTVNAGAAVNSDNGSLAYKLSGTSPYAVGTSTEYSYTIHVYDDDDPALYGGTALTAAQLTNMGGENGNRNSDVNQRMVLRVTGNGPNNTSVTVSRILESVSASTTTTTTTTTITDPALLIGGDLTISGNIHLLGSKGSVHANGNMTMNGNAATVSGDATSSGTASFNQNWHAGGSQGGGRPVVNVPNVQASNYLNRATHVMEIVGGVAKVRTVATGVSCNAPCLNWSYSAGTWSITGNTATAGTFYANGAVTVSGSPKIGNGNNATPYALSIIATGSISITGSPMFYPHASSGALQFVTNGDLRLGGNSDEDYLAVEGQSLVREQLDIHGNPDLRGQIIVQNVPSVQTLVASNVVAGNPTITYNGSFADIVSTASTTTAGPTTYTNNVSGWLEGK